MDLIRELAAIEVTFRTQGYRVSEDKMATMQTEDL